MKCFELTLCQEEELYAVGKQKIIRCSTKSKIQHYCQEKQAEANFKNLANVTDLHYEDTAQLG